jgi:hypothetical protein
LISSVAPTERPAGCAWSSRPRRRWRALEVDDPQTMQAVIARATALRRPSRRADAHVAHRVWSIAAVCSIVGIALYGIPLAADRLAPLVPY